VAAPTAGLHLSERLLSALDARGIERAEVVLHVGAGTFRPLRQADLDAGRLHAEAFDLPSAAADAVARARARGGRVVAVGTTAARVLESCGVGDGEVEARSGETELFLRPGARFGVVDALLTNFHLPRSSLLLLVAAFAGRERVLAAYAAAQAASYRFYSFGDAMLVQ
jgi:S-adenosylmethionine:tRNA ribosyltransferase-isomerase